MANFWNFNFSTLSLSLFFLSLVLVSPQESIGRSFGRGSAGVLLPLLPQREREKLWEEDRRLTVSVIKSQFEAQRVAQSFSILTRAT